MNRIEPASAPYAPDVQAAFDHLMPPGIEPLALFRTLARSPRVFHKFLAGSLLDEGALTLRQREIVILRTCALNGCGYEWGVHVAIFGGRAAFGPVHVAATVSGDRSVWTPAEAALLTACEELDRTVRLSEPAWVSLRAHFDEAQILELISLTGFYRTVCLHVHALNIAPEPWAPVMPAR